MIYLIAILLYTLAIVYICLDYHCNSDHTFCKHRVNYDFENRNVVIDGLFVIAAFRQGSLNCEFFEFIYKNPGKSLTVEEIEDSVFKGQIVELNKMADAMGFKGELKRLLFSYDARSFTYHPDKLNQIKGPIYLK